MPTASEVDLFTKPMELWVTPGFSGRFTIPWPADVSTGGMELYIDGASQLTAYTTGSESTSGNSITYRRIENLPERKTARIVFKMTDAQGNVSERLFDLRVSRKKD